MSALETKGLVRRLAEPDLVALPGDKASFLAGGEFPVPISANVGRLHHAVDPVQAVRRGIGFRADGARRRCHQFAARSVRERT